MTAALQQHCATRGKLPGTGGAVPALALVTTFLTMPALTLVTTFSTIAPGPVYLGKVLCNFSHVQLLSQVAW